MTKTYRAQLEVRGHEIDGFGHVNHAVYLQYMEAGRWEMLHSVGITLEKIREWQRWPVIAGIEIQYLRPCYTGDRLEVQTRIVDHRRTGFTLTQEILRGEEPVARATVRSAIVNEKGRPAEVPAEFQTLWSDS